MNISEFKALKLSRTMELAIARAAKRDEHRICPIPRLHGEAEQMIIEGLTRRALIDVSMGPRLTDKGLEAAAIVLGVEA